MITFKTVYFTVHILCMDRGKPTHWQTPTLSPSFDRIQNTGINLLIQNYHNQDDHPGLILRIGIMSSRLLIHVMKEVSRTCTEVTCPPPHKLSIIGSVLLYLFISMTSYILHKLVFAVGIGSHSALNCVWNVFTRWILILKYIASSGNSTVHFLKN